MRWVSMGEEHDKDLPALAEYFKYIGKKINNITNTEEIKKEFEEKQQTFNPEMVNFMKSREKE
jgi:hypothetical protein